MKFFIICILDGVGITQNAQLTIRLFKIIYIKAFIECIWDSCGSDEWSNGEF